MKNLRLLLVLLATFLFSISYSTNPDNTSWMSNISEGSGSMPTGIDDDHHQFYTLGETIHVIWISRDDGVELKYRRSIDGGVSWDQEKVIFSASDRNFIDPNILNRRLYASGNFVHIALLNTEGYGNNRLLYFRSINSGQSFEGVREIFAPDHWYLTDMILSGDKEYINIGLVHDCQGCGGIPTPYIFHSNDNGESFSQRNLPESYKGYEYNTWDMKTDRERIYFIALRPIGPWYEYEFDLLFNVSTDGGMNFQNSVISTPSASGNGQPFYFMDTHWSYTPKIAFDQGIVGVVWAGFNENDQNTLFTAISDNYGQSFNPTKKLVQNIGNYQTGLETIAINGEDIFITYNTSNSKVFWLYSDDAGNSFIDPMELTQEHNKSVSTAWGGSLSADKINGGAYFASSGPLIAKLSTNPNEFKIFYAGNYSLPTRTVYTMVNDYGDLHLLFRVGNAYLWNAGWSDYDIYHKAMSSDLSTQSQVNNSARFDVTALEANSEGYSQYANLTVPHSNSLMFNDEVSIEIIVKPDIDNEGRTILTQYHSQTWNPWNPGSTQLWLNPNNKEELLVGIMTSSGPYVLASRSAIREGFWNHITVTYNNDGTAGNLRLYINGQLDNSMTATGKFESNSNWILGAFKDDNVKDGFNGEFDEFRLWSKALSIEEIQESILKPINSIPEDLICYINFDEVNNFGQLMDVSGKKNHGFFMYNESLKESTVIDMDVSFSYTQELNTCYFTSDVDEANALFWDFGDGEESVLVNPSHSYPSPDIYTVCLTADKEDNYGVFCDEVEIQGIDRIQPIEAGNDGGLTLFVYGAGFTEDAIVVIRMEGENDIQSIKTIKSEEGDLTAVFEFDNIKKGTWDVVVQQGNGELIHEKSLNIVETREAKPWVSFNGGGNILKGRWTPQTLVIGNSGNVDAYGVLLWFIISDLPNVDVEFVNVNFTMPQLAIDMGYIDRLSVLEEFVEVDELFDQVAKKRVYPMYFHYLPAGISYNIDLRVKTDEIGDFKAETFVSPPFYQSPLSTEVQACIAFAAAKAFIKAGLGFIPGAPCITGALGVAAKVADTDPPPPSASEYIDLNGWPWVIGTTFLECAASLTPAHLIKTVQVALEVVTSTADGFQEAEDCKRGIWPEPFSIFQILYHGVSSFDPNEKYGPSGYGQDNFIGESSKLSYKISFENKPDATAPAHEVFITDTLDTELLDLNDFQFGSLGFSDTLIYPSYGLNEFSYDIDLRPEKNVIVRVYGGLDTNTGIVNWKYTSLNPETMDLPFDPFGGFLPPNQNSPEGEGYVTFTVGIKEDVSNNDVINNFASIVFDSNEPIITNVHSTSFDLDPPESFILQPDSEETKDTITTLHLNGQDSESGIRLYEIWMSKDGDPFEFHDLLVQDSFEFRGEFGSVYELYSIALDKVGNREVTPLIPDVEFTLTTGVNRPDTNLNNVSVYPNPVRDLATLEIILNKQELTTVYFTNQSGMRLELIYSGKLNSGINKVDLDMKLFPAGVYLIEIQTGDKRFFSKFLKI